VIPVLCSYVYICLDLNFCLDETKFPQRDVSLEKLQYANEANVQVYEHNCLRNIGTLNAPPLLNKSAFSRIVYFIPFTRKRVENNQMSIESPYLKEVI
jgi:hypothetical protein